MKSIYVVREFFEFIDSSTNHNPLMVGLLIDVYIEIFTRRSSEFFDIQVMLASIKQNMLKGRRKP